MNSYRNFVSEFARVAREGASSPLGGFPPTTQRSPLAGAPKVLIFSPHPDDESITGGLALRLLRESQWNVINVAVTLGSKMERRTTRLAELRGACDYLGFELTMPSINRGVPPPRSGLENINLSTRNGEPTKWSSSVDAIASMLQQFSPRVIFFPHETDWNSTHIGTHFLVRDALAKSGELDCFLVETEFWGQMAAPNLLVEYSVEDVSDLVAAVSFHAGEVQRNPFHLKLPAWMHDNVRRGGELVNGQGRAAPDFVFAQLFRLSRWRSGRVETTYAGGQTLPVTANPATLFGL